MNKCENCPRKCGIDRTKSIGFCGEKNKLKVALVSKHFGEEPIISGKKGSGTVFFSGCNLKCVFCQNYKISSENFGKEISVNRLVEIFKELEEQKVCNINLVSPTQFSKQILKALKIYKPKIPIIWNSNGYENVKTIKKLEKYVDVYLVDCKFFDKELSKKYCRAENYFDVCFEVIKEMLRQKQKNIFKNGLIKSGVIIRHLVMPNCTNDSLKILDIIEKNFSGAIVSVMAQYTPCYLACNFKEINRPLKEIEYNRVVNKFKKLNIKNGYMQELCSCGENYVPNFNLNGVIKK